MLPFDLAEMSPKVLMFLYPFLIPTAKSNKSNEIYAWASSTPVFLKKVFVDFHKSLLSTPVLTSSFPAGA